MGSAVVQQNGWNYYTYCCCSTCRGEPMRRMQIHNDRHILLIAAWTGYSPQSILWKDAYQERVPHMLLWTPMVSPHVVICIKGVAARRGSLKSPYKYFKYWKTRRRGILTGVPLKNITTRLRHVGKSFTKNGRMELCEAGLNLNVRVRRIWEVCLGR